eukprot:CAMPEP_0206464382 /NCGR_PEP_ID=MMETSP0324_2-20121206/27183_1 /ASSEMBLY_ACC=CAM_ASM_000836 /TAXON_ID=2866 /ORGANISM="Crypthecodinium cohnii, Strain Seligo" /LENGTH=182 /DNA_ID=CAMNT_0053937003 /DNA_START=53 /DNA_END=601 /DNA_ORIENTATION=+
MAKCVLLFASAVASMAGATTVEGWTYNPESPSEPFDNVAETVTGMIHNYVPVDRQDDGWQGRFCSCMENGHISSWYQYASAMYLIDTCNPDTGLILRSGHLQDRHTEPLEGMMACDTLKLISYCLSHHAQEALPTWKNTCSNAHYTVPACDVDCSGATHTFGQVGLMAAALAAVTAFMGQLA